MVIEDEASPGMQRKLLSMLLHLFSPCAVDRVCCPKGNSRFWESSQRIAAGVPFTLPREPYAQIVGIGANNDGYTEKGITFPSSQAQAELAIRVRTSMQPLVLLLFTLNVHASTCRLGCVNSSKSSIADL